MCFGGGGNAAAEARAEEERRRAEIEAAQRKLESIFSSPSREAQIQDFVSGRRDLLFSDLDREHRDNQLQTKFALARSGLGGGSVDVDTNRLLAETYLRGIAEAERQAQTAGADLRSRDQQAKQGLFSTILAGGDSTTAAQNAAQSLRNNLAFAKNDSIVGAFDSLFGDFGDIYKRSREAAGERRASYEFGSLFGPRPQTQARVSGGL